MVYYDFHSHILPGMDDGSKDREMSRQMLTALKSQGVEHVMFTPHFIGMRESADEFIKRRSEALGRLMRVYDEDKMPSFGLGAEVYLYNGISRQDLKALSFYDDYILLEMPDVFSGWILDEIDKIMLKGLRIIFAHIERPFMNYSSKDFGKLIDYSTFLYQLNVAALENSGLRRHFLKEFKKGGQFVIGSDAHNMSSRKPDFDSKALLRRDINKEFIHAVRHRSEKILNKVVKINGSQQHQ